jgi:hypothetical protein
MIKSKIMEMNNVGIVVKSLDGDKTVTDIIENT